MTGNLQYISDTLLIEKISIMDAGLRKEAGISDILGGAASSIASWAGSQMGPNPGMSSIMKFLGELLLTGTLTKVWWPLGILYGIASSMGLNLSNIVEKVVSFVKGSVSEGKKPTMEEINQVGKEAVAAEAGSLEDKAELRMASDMLYHLRHIDKNGELLTTLTKHADVTDELRSFLGQKTRSSPDISFFGGKGTWIERIFGNLFKVPGGRSRARWLLGGLIVWFLKTALLGAGLIAGTGAVMSFFGAKKQEAKPETQETPEAPPVGSAYTAPEINLTPTGKGHDIHTNDYKTTWLVPVIGGSIVSTLIAWAGYVYEELQGQGRLISQTNSFNKMVNEMSTNFQPSDPEIEVPVRFKSIKQMVDQFAPEAASKLKRS